MLGRIQTTGAGWAAAVALVLMAFAPAAHAGPGNGRGQGKFDPELRMLADRSTGTSRIIVVMKSGTETDGRRYGGFLRQRLDLINSSAIELPNAALRELEKNPDVESIHLDRPVVAHLNRVAVTVGARAVQQSIGLRRRRRRRRGHRLGHHRVARRPDQRRALGAVSVRTTSASRRSSTSSTAGLRRTTTTATARTSPASSPATATTRTARRPASRRTRPWSSLKVLDANGRARSARDRGARLGGRRTAHDYNIRVVNLSVGAAVTESYLTDPLTLAAKRAVDAGIVVVAAAGNFGKNAAGAAQYGGITAPGNAPWVLTVGASSTNGTVARTTTSIAQLQLARVRPAIDYLAKPDLVAPGTGMVSLSDPAARSIDQRRVPASTARCRPPTSRI